MVETRSSAYRDNDGNDQPGGEGAQAPGEDEALGESGAALDVQLEHEQADLDALRFADDNGDEDAVAAEGEQHPGQAVGAIGGHGDAAGGGPPDGGVGVSQQQQQRQSHRRQPNATSDSGADASQQQQHEEASAAHAGRQQHHHHHLQRPQTTQPTPFKLRSEELHARYAAQFAERVAAERAASEELQRRQRSVAYLKQQLDEEYAGAAAAAARAPPTPKSKLTPTRPEPFRLAIDGRMDEWHSRHATPVSTEEMELKQAEEEQQRLRRQLHDAREAARAALVAAPSGNKPNSARVQTALPVTVARPFRLQGVARSAQYRQRWRERLEGEREAEASRLRAASSHCAPGSSGAHSRLMASVQEYVRRARSFAGDGGRESTTSSTVLPGHHHRHGKHGGSHGGGGLARSQSLCHTCGRDRKFRALPMPVASIPPFRPDLSLAAPATRPRPPALATEARLGAKAGTARGAEEEFLPQHTPVLLSGDGLIEAYATTLRCPPPKPQKRAGGSSVVGASSSKHMAARQQQQQQERAADAGTELDVEAGVLSTQPSLQPEQQQQPAEEYAWDNDKGNGEGASVHGAGDNTHREEDARFVDAEDE